MKYYIRGGVGDLLQSLWFIQKFPDHEYIVHVHNDSIKQILDEAGVKKYYFYPFNDLESHNDQVDNIKNDHSLSDSQDNVNETPRAFYSDITFSPEAEEEALKIKNSFKQDKEIVGIHPFRSDFALSVYDYFKLPAKVIPLSITKQIIDENKNYLIFGSAKEINNYGLEESDNIKFVSCNKIQNSLTAVKYCSSLIGLDSGFKTMSSMLRINTICIIGDFKDPTRDAYFINQYENDNVMSVFRTKDIEKDSRQIVEFIKNNIGNKFGTFKVL